MKYRLSYRQILPTSIQQSREDDSLWFVGSFKAEEIPFESSKFPKAYRSALEWFANQPFDREEDILAFTREYGLLRWNWTHEGHGGSQHDQFYLPVNAFRESQIQFRRYWAFASDRRRVKDVIGWLCVQLAPESGVAEVEKPEEAWKLSQPRMGFRVEPVSGGIGVRLLVGDLWQALCFALLERLSTSHGQLRICKNELCEDLKFFIAQSKKQKAFCSPECAKRTADRNHVRRKRARLRKKTSRKEK